MATIGQTAKYLRSKNAGPFWLTIDAFCNSVEDTEKIAATFERDRTWIAEVFHVAPEHVKIFCLPEIQVAKVSVPRVPIEGSTEERDMHGGQQYVTLLDLEVESHTDISETGKSQPLRV